MESIKTNLALIRRRIKYSDLGVEMLTVGRKTNTYVSLVYMADIINIDILNNLRHRIKTIDTQNYIMLIL